MVEREGGKVLEKQRRHVLYEFRDHYWNNCMYVCMYVWVYLLVGLGGYCWFLLSMLVFVFTVLYFLCAKVAIFIFAFFSSLLKLHSNVLVYRDKIIFNCCRNIRVSVSNVHLHDTLYYNMRERVNFKIVL